MPSIRIPDKLDDRIQLASVLLDAAGDEPERVVIGTEGGFPAYQVDDDLFDKAAAIVQGDDLDDNDDALDEADADTSDEADTATTSAVPDPAPAVPDTSEEATPVAEDEPIAEHVPANKPARKAPAKKAAAKPAEPKTDGDD